MISLIFLTLSFYISIIYSQIPTYNYLKNGADWNGTCQTGTQQSPININTRKVVPWDSSFNMGITFRDNVTTETENILVTYKTFANWSTLTLEMNQTTSDFDALQFHFHAPSEHTVNGDNFDGEIHIVQNLRGTNVTNLTRNLAVLGIFILVNDSAEDHPFFVNYDPTTTEEFTLNLSQTLGNEIIKDANFFTYDGSLTTPPCSEVVHWFVMDAPIQVTQKQMDKLQDAWAKNANFAGGKGNNRITLPLNGRLVKTGSINNGTSKNFSMNIGLLIFLIAILISFNY